MSIPASFRGVDSILGCVGDSLSDGLRHLGHCIAGGRLQTDVRLVILLHGGGGSPARVPADEAAALEPPPQPLAVPARERRGLARAGRRQARPSRLARQPSFFGLWPRTFGDQ